MERKVRKKKYFQLTFTEIFFLVAFACLLTVVEFQATLVPARKQLRDHIREAKELVEQYKENEEETEVVVENIYQSRADVLAYAIRNEIGGPPTRKHLQEYARLLYLNNLIIKEGDEVLESAYDPQQHQDFYWVFETEIDENRTLRLETSDRFGHIIDQLNDAIAWEAGISTLTIGKKGYTFVVNSRDGKVLEHPDPKMIGEQMRTDSMRHVKWKQEDAEESSPLSLLIGNCHLVFIGHDCLLARYFPMSEQEFGQEYVVCGLPLEELVQNFLVYFLIIFSLYLLVTMQFFGFICFSVQEWSKKKHHYVYDDEDEDEGGEERLEHEEAEHVVHVTRIGKYITDPVFMQKILAYILVGSFVCFCISTYLIQLNTVSSYSVICRARAEGAHGTLKNCERMSDSLKKIFGMENLIQCRLIARLLEEEPAYKTREKLKELAELSDVVYIYVFNKHGRVTVTNSPYDHFKLSRKKGDQSYDFLPLLDGREYVIQDPMPDDSSQKTYQYVGVSVRNEEDLADGFVQIAIQPEKLEKILESINISAKLGSINVANKGFAFAVDRKTKKVIYANREAISGKSAKKLGIAARQMKDGYNGLVNILGEEYFSSVKECINDCLVFVVIPKADVHLYNLSLCVLIAVASGACMLCLSLIAGLYKEDELLPETWIGELPDRSDSEKPDRAAEESKEAAEGRKLLSGKAAAQREMQRQDAPPGKPVSGRRGGLFGNGKMRDDIERMSLLGLWNSTNNVKLEERWNGNRVSWKNKTPEQKIVSITKRGLLLFCLFVAWLYFYGSRTLSEQSLLLYIIRGRWQKGLNLLAITACLLIICVTYVVVKCMLKLLYLIARVSGPRTETMCHLLRSVIKYGSVIAILYYCLAQLGINTRTLVASAGIFSLVVGLGAQGLIMDILSGLFIVFENLFSIGDLIMVDGWMGYVTEIGIRTTKVAFYKDIRCFNNSEVCDVKNYSADEVVVVTHEMPVSYEESIERIKKIFKQELPLLKDRIVGALDEPRYFGIVRLEDSAIIVRFEVACASEVRLRCESTFYRELLLMFRRNDITVPYPQLTLSGQIDPKGLV